MQNKKENETLQEILEEDSIAVKKKNKKKGCFVRFLLILTLLVLFAYGFLYVTQYLADLEAEARVRAILTASAYPGSSESAVEEATVELVPTETPEPAAANSNLDLERTATIAAQLTSVADFQASQTPSQ
jgi:hypothetical protein